MNIDPALRGPIPVVSSIGTYTHRHRSLLRHSIIHIITNKINLPEQHLYNDSTKKKRKRFHGGLNPKELQTSKD